MGKEKSQNTQLPVREGLSEDPTGPALGHFITLDGRITSRFILLLTVVLILDMVIPSSWCSQGIICYGDRELWFDQAQSGLPASRRSDQKADPYGFFQAFGGAFDPDRIHGKLGNPMAIIEPGVSIKPYPCGVVGHSTMEAMRALVIEHDVKPEHVDHINVTTGSNILPPKGPLKYKKTQTVLQAKFSVPFQMASMIIRRKVGMMEFTDEFVQSPAVQAMMDRVETSINPEFDAFGRNRYVSVVEVRLKDGRVLEGRSPEYLPGSPRNPLSHQVLAEKFKDCTQGVLTVDQAERLLETINRLDQLGDIRSLIEGACPH